MRAGRMGGQHSLLCLRIEVFGDVEATKLDFASCLEAATASR